MPISEHEGSRSLTLPRRLPVAIGMLRDASYSGKDPVSICVGSRYALGDSDEGSLSVLSLLISTRARQRCTEPHGKG